MDRMTEMPTSSIPTTLEPASEIKTLVATLASSITSHIARRWADDSFRQSVRANAVEGLGWTFAGTPADLSRIAHLAAVMLVADLGLYAAFHRHEGHPGAADSLLLDRLSIADGPGFPRATRCERFLRDLALAALPLADRRRIAERRATFDLGRFPIDVLGPLFEGAGRPDERRQAGQFYSAADPIDLILGFCLRSPADAVLDPACGSGAFLVRALSRLAALDAAAPPASLAAQLHGTDLDRLALRLAGYSISARTSTWPDLRSDDFFKLRAAAFPPVDAVVGNPPYTRQEALADRSPAAKGAIRSTIADDWQCAVSGRAGLHVPFLLHAASFLRPGGHLGMLTSNSWLSAGYGRALRRFLLDHCRVVAIIAPSAERWFGAAVNPIALIAAGENDGAARRAHRARFVRLKRPLRELIGEAGSGERWESVDHLVDRILGTADRHEDGDMTIRAVCQAELDAWGGLDRALEGAGTRGREEKQGQATGGGGSSWPIFLKAPRVYFTLLSSHRQRFCALGDVATIRRGFTTGANHFFYVREVTEGRSQGEASASDLRLVMAGDGSQHLIEARYLAPVLVSPRELTSLIAAPEHARHRVVLLPAERAELEGTRALEYLRWGESASAGHKGLPPAMRVTCSNRQTWWHLEPVPAGALLWSKTHFARHLAPLNPDSLYADCNLYHVTPFPGIDTIVLGAILNSTLVALFKELHGRANLGEGALKTEVADLLSLPIPDPRLLVGEGASLSSAFGALALLPVGALPAELERPERRALDETILALLGEDAPEARREELYAGVIRLLTSRTAIERPFSLPRQAAPLEPATLAALALADLAGLPSGDGESPSSRLRAILSSYTSDRKLIAAALRFVLDDGETDAGNLP